MSEHAKPKSTPPRTHKREEAEPSKPATSRTHPPVRPGTLPPGTKAVAGLELHWKGENVQKLLDRHKMSRNALAVALDVGNSQPQRWCDGNVPEPAHLIKLALFFRVPVTWFFDLGPNGINQRDVISALARNALGEEEADVLEFMGHMVPDRRRLLVDTAKGWTRQ